MRILLPFVAGILFAVSFSVNYNSFGWLLALCLVAVALFFTERKWNHVLPRYIFIVTADAFLFLCALYCCFHYNVRNSSAYFGHYIGSGAVEWTGTVTDLSQEKEKFVKVKMQVGAVQNAGKAQPATGEVMVYFKKPVDPALFQPGNRLAVSSTFIPFKEPMNPGEFNYRGFMADKNIFYQVFADSGQVKLLGKSGFSLQLAGLKIKKAILERFASSDLDAGARNLCAALLTGYDDEISPETINAFAHSGTLHVLSVSGLHTGILYAMLLFVFGLIDRHRKFKLLQLICIVAALWFFALITGFSPPVLRAVVMLSLIATGRFYFNPDSGNGANILAVSAFGILFFSPLLLFDTGFLLSYTAIIGILYFQPAIEEMVSTENRILKKLWQLSSVSIAAQLSTLPLTLALFHQFPLWFVFSNLAIIPLCTVVMALAFLVLLHLPLVAGVVNVCNRIISYLIALTDDPQWGYLDGIDFGKSDALILGCCIILFSISVGRRSYVATGAAMLLILYWQLVSITEAVAEKNSQAVAVYHVNRQTALEVRNKTRLYYSGSTTKRDRDYHVRPAQCMMNYPDHFAAGIDYVKLKELSLFHYKTEAYGPLLRFLDPAYVLVSDGARLTEDTFRELKNVKLVIADGSNNYKQVKEISQLCAKFDVPFHATREKGYISIDANEVKNRR